MLTWSAFGAPARGERLARIERSPRRSGKRFVNELPVETHIGRALVGLLRGSPVREPHAPIAVRRRDAAEFSAPPASGLRVTWLGHSSMLVEIGGRRFLTDPVFSERISPSPSLGPRRFYQTPIEPSRLPPLDAVLISHDHFDHLDMPTIAALSSTTFVCPLGVGAHLEHWGVDPARIVELDWYDETSVGGVALVCTPARHFSGRSPGGRDSTLWAGWALISAKHRVFFSGDTGMFPGFRDIGERLGPFDLTMIEAGAYNAAWADVHLGPEQAVRAHELLRGRVLMPVHWGTYNLALHGWTEPAERALVAARRRGVTLAMPGPGDSFDPLDPPAVRRWWPELPWQPASEHRVVSSRLPGWVEGEVAAP